MAQRLPIAEKTVQASREVPGFNPNRWSPDDLGAGIGRGLQQLGATGRDLAVTVKAVQDERKANNAYAHGNLAKDELRTGMLDPNNGILSRTGINSEGATRAATDLTNDIRQKYLDQIDDPETREVWAKMWDREAETAKDQAARHELAQVGAMKAQTEKATLQQSMLDAYDFYNDQEQIDAAIDRSRRLIKANSIGADPATIALAEAQATSQIHLAVISRYAQEDPAAGLEYYKGHASEITGADHVEAGKFLNPAIEMQKAKQETARIVGTGGQITHNLWSALEFTESSGNPQAESGAGAAGIAQIIPSTARYMAKKFGLSVFDGLTDEEVKTELKANVTLSRNLGQGYLQEMLDQFGGDIEAALVGYNGGPDNAEAFLRHNVGRKAGQRDYNVPGFPGIKKESEPYVQKILGAYSGGQGAAGKSVSRMTPENWTLKNFRPEDILAPTEGGRWVNSTAALSLDEAATRFAAQFPGVKIKINEINNSTMTAGKRRGTSDPKDNPHVENSQHIHGTAFDIQIQGMTDVQKAALLSTLRQVGFRGFGFYGPGGHLHADMGNERTWGSVPAWAKSAMKVPIGKVDGLPAPSYTAEFGGAGGTGQAPGAPGALYTGPQMPATNAYIEQAMAITDPGVRSLVLAEINRQSALQESAVKQQEAMAKQDAWNKVIQGSVNDLSPQELSRLEPSFVNSLRAYETGRDKPGGIQNDWNAWSKASLMSEEELLATDLYTNFRPILDDEHFDKLIAYQRSAAEKARGNQAAASEFAGMRTRAEILNDTMHAMRWTDKKDGEAIASLGRRLDQQLALHQTITGKPADAIAMQDMVDKLLLQDLNDDSWLPGVGGQGAAFGAKDPSTFIAAESWDTVQPDDQTALVNTYNLYYNDVPDQETAVDLYNRAMQVWLGAKPTGPEDEVNALRAGIEQRFGRTITEQELELHHGQWLLTFLGLRPLSRRP